MKVCFFMFAVAVALLNFSCNNNNNNPATDTTAEKDTLTLKQDVNAPFVKQVDYKKFSITVSSPNVDTNNIFVLIASGYTVDSMPQTFDIPEKIIDVKIADIDGDDCPEIAVIAQTGADSARKAYLFSSNGNKSISVVNLPKLSAEELSKSGYNGRDEYAFGDNSFVHRFPVYANNAATGKYHQLQYTLKPGEAMKQLVLTNTTDF